MTDKLLEQVSALADDELSAREAELLLARMERDPDLRTAWERYHAIGEAMRGGLSANPGFAEQVAAVIDAEPAGERFARARTLLNLRPLAGMAIAASVAMLAVFTLQGPEPGSPSEVVPGAGSRPAALPVIAPRQADFSGVRSPELQDQLRGYLINHSEHAGTARLRGVMPYVQIAAHDTRPVDTVEEDAARPDGAPEQRD